MPSAALCGFIIDRKKARLPTKTGFCLVFLHRVLRDQVVEYPPEEGGEGNGRGQNEQGEQKFKDSHEAILLSRGAFFAFIIADGKRKSNTLA
jgi:hypothetical protein